MEAEADGWVTVHATGGWSRPEPFLVRDIRAAVELLRRHNRRPAFIPADPGSPLAAMGYAGIELVADKGYSPTRRWLRAERAWLHQLQLAGVPIRHDVTAIPRHVFVGAIRWDSPNRPDEV